MKPVVTVAEMRAIDVEAQRTVSEATLVERAGTAVAVEALRLLGGAYGRRVVVVGAGQTDFQLEDQPIGNGRALAILLARDGAQVVVVDRDETSADETTELIRAEGGTANTVVADVSRISCVMRLPASMYR